jgi:hypothetical protein
LRQAGSKNGRAVAVADKFVAQAAQKKSGLVMHPPGNPAEPERIVKALCWNCYGDPQSCFHSLL